MSFRCTSVASALLAGLHLSTAFVLTPTGQTLNLDGIPYYSPPNVVTNIASFGTGASILQAAAEAGGLLPITVVSANSTSYTGSDFAATVADYVAKDDVFSAGFLEAVYVQYLTTSRVSGCNLTSGLNITGPIATTYTSSDAAIPDGPYFVSSTGAVYEAWRLYSDSQGAFFETAIGNGDGTYSVLPANVAGQSRAVAVPSRIYFTPTTEKPLAGVRIGVKDIFDIAGLKTSDGNRAWYHFYPPANKTALPIQRLIDAGAIIVGKMATSQFANGETATADWVDYHEPFNPRGDGYQDTSSSSAGPGAGTGAYDWLDITVGSDTGGSIRGPSQVQGLYGNRASVGLVPLTGVMPMSPESDTAGFLTRHPALWKTAAEVMYETNITISHSYPSKVLTTGFPTSVEMDGDALLLDFVSNLTTFLNATTSDWNMTTAWAETRPANATADYEVLLNLTYPILIGKHEVINLRDPFYEAYGKEHDGRQPFIDPVPLIRWNWSDTYPLSAIDDARANNSLFASWFSSTVLVADNKTCSDSLLLYIGSQATVTYRNVYRLAPAVPYGYFTGSISPYWGGPDFVIPLGVASYFSDVTNHVEYLPVTVDIMAAKGCDGMLYALINDMFDAGLLSTPLTGYSSTTGGEILFKRSAAFQGSGFVL
ncbi:amidase signature domain-containing protein [Delphinella strobiligena]|nr:amidase signature domain-containing protein [Delphinella strobiligena]